MSEFWTAAVLARELVLARPDCGKRHKVFVLCLWSVVEVTYAMVSIQVFFALFAAGPPGCNACQARGSAHHVHGQPLPAQHGLVSRTGGRRSAILCRHDAASELRLPAGQFHWPGAGSPAAVMKDVQTDRNLAVLSVWSRRSAGCSRVQ